MDKQQNRKTALSLLGVAVSVIPVLIATISYFPIWQERGAYAVLSGGLLLLLTVCILPIVKLIKKLLCSPSVYLLWLIIFLFFSAMRSIVDELTVISFVGFVSNLIGAALYRAGGGVLEK